MSIDVCVSLAAAYSQTSKDTMTSSNKLETVKVNFRHLEAPASHQPVTCSVATAVVALIWGVTPPLWAFRDISLYLLINSIQSITNNASDDSFVRHFFHLSVRFAFGSIVVTAASSSSFTSSSSSSPSSCTCFSSSSIAAPGPRLVQLNSRSVLVHKQKQSQGYKKKKKKRMLLYRRLRI